MKSFYSTAWCFPLACLCCFMYLWSGRWKHGSQIWVQILSFLFITHITSGKSLKSPFPSSHGGIIPTHRLCRINIKSQYLINLNWIYYLGVIIYVSASYWSFSPFPFSLSDLIVIFTQTTGRKVHLLFFLICQKKCRNLIETKHKISFCN